jgi:hypothetical protein
MTDYVITTYQTSVPPEEFADFGHTQGDWYWQLDDGHLPAGRYLTEDAAQEAAIDKLEQYRDVMGSRIGLVTWLRADGHRVDCSPENDLPPAA